MTLIFLEAEKKLAVCSCFLSFIAQIQKLGCMYSWAYKSEVVPMVKPCLTNWTHTSPCDLMGNIQGCWKSWLTSMWEATLSHLWRAMAIVGGSFWLGERKNNRKKKKQTKNIAPTSERSKEDLGYCKLVNLTSIPGNMWSKYSWKPFPGSLRTKW